MVEPVGDVTNTDMYHEMINGLIPRQTNGKPGDLTNVNSNQQYKRVSRASRASNTSQLNKSRTSVNLNKTRSSYVAQKTTEFDTSKQAKNLLNFESKLDKDL